MEFNGYQGNVHAILQSTFSGSIKNCIIRKLRLRYTTCVLLHIVLRVWTRHFRVTLPRPRGVQMSTGELIPDAILL